MSEQRNGQTEQPAESPGKPQERASVTVSPEPEATPDTAASGSTGGHDSSSGGREPPPPPRSRGSRLSLVLCLLLACAIGYLAWMLEQQQQLIAGLSGQQGELAEQRDSADAGLEALEDMVGNLQSALGETRAELETQRERMQEVNDQLTNTRLRLENVDAASRDDPAWLLAEVESMLRLAQQRLVMARDTRTAIALMLASDEILRDIDDSSLYPVREAVADDIAALRAVPELDVEGGFLRIGSVIDRISNLQLRNRTEEQLSAATPYDPSAGESTIDRWLERLGDMVSVRRLDEPLQGMISAEQGYYIRQNIRLLLEQAQLALWRGQEQIYTDNIDRALDYLEQYFLRDDAEYRAVTGMLTELRERPVSVPIPPASSGLSALRRVMDAYERGDSPASGQ